MTGPKKVLIFGAASSIVYETAKLFAGDGASLFLCARDDEALKRISADLQVRGAEDVGVMTFDAMDEGSIERAVKEALVKFPDIDCMLIGHGTLPDQSVCESDIAEMRKAIEINFTSVAVILTHVSEHFRKLGRGSIVVISSVAGDRGRQSNYVYGSAKSALTTFLAGLRQRLSKSGVNILTIKPGFVDTPMTSDYKKGLLFVGPDVIARGIYKAIIKKKNTVYLPWFWWWIMFIIRNIPERIFNKIKL